jgi:hypothetical protein
LLLICRGIQVPPRPCSLVSRASRRRSARSGLALPRRTVAFPPLKPSPLMTESSGSVSKPKIRVKSCPELRRNAVVMASLAPRHGRTRGILGSIRAKCRRGVGDSLHFSVFRFQQPVAFVSFSPFPPIPSFYSMCFVVNCRLAPDARQTTTTERRATLAPDR